MVKCEVCNRRDSERSSIVRGKYYSTLCTPCYESLLQDNAVSSGHADYERGRDAEEHEADIRQPMTNGIPDAEFIRLYPDTAKKIFSTEEIHRAIRS